MIKDINHIGFTCDNLIEINRKLGKLLEKTRRVGVIKFHFAESLAVQRKPDG